MPLNCSCWFLCALTVPVIDLCGWIKESDCFSERLSNRQDNHTLLLPFLAGPGHSYILILPLCLHWACAADFGSHSPPRASCGALQVWPLTFSPLPSPLRKPITYSCEKSAPFSINPVVFRGLSIRWCMSECLNSILSLFMCFSAGVGRSGTFVTLLWLMQLCARGIRPDVRAAVEDLRLHRMWMVQNLVSPALRYFT